MAETQSLKGHVAIVTGASSGIGRAIAIRLGGAGAHVFLSGRNESLLAEGARAAEAAGGRATAIAGDARDVKQVQGLVDQAVKRTGRLDMLEVNVLALLVGSQAAIRAMRACGAQGHIVNVSSVAGRREASGVYGATKWAVNAIATTLRQELESDSIRVVNIIPGAVATNFARNFPPAVVAGIVNSLGIKADIKPGGHLAPEVLDQIAANGKLFLAAADDIARAVLFAVTQPIELNIFEMVVRPQRQLQLPA